MMRARGLELEGLKSRCLFRPPGTSVVRARDQKEVLL